MNHPLLLYAGAVGVLAFTASVLVHSSYRAFAAIPKEEGLSAYSSEAERGRAHYVSLGCVYCHSQQPRDPSLAPDEARGWGRPSTPGDYAFDYPHVLGTMRTGPDLFNIGARQPSRDWHLQHLYAPRSVSTGSIMPAYEFLFVKKTRAEANDVVVKLGTPPGDGGGVVATNEALELVTYLQSLDHTYKSQYIDEKGASAAEKGGAR
jgi:cytochrome c oxidase cbb3-type subunit 2